MSKIEWTEKTWNPIVGCSVVSHGCTSCYAMRMAARLERMGVPQYAGLTKPSKAGPVWTGETRLVESALTLPLRTRRPTMWFVNSMSDLFHESVPDEAIDRVFAVMALAPQHTLQVLTKRSARMRAYLTQERRHAVSEQARRIADEEKALFPLRAAVKARLVTAAIEAEIIADPLGSRWPLPNVWLGVSTEDQRRADKRVPDLLATPAAVRFVSAEPLLSAIDFTRILISEEACEALHPTWEGVKRIRFLINALSGSETLKCSALDWIIVGGESGPGARPMHPNWVRSIRDQCAEGGTAFFFKQWGEWAQTRPEAGGDLGGDMRADQVRIVKPAGENDGHFRRGDRLMRRVGKRAAGRLLDGVTHNGMPGARP